MKNEWIREMKATERLKLTFSGYLTHYLIVFFIFIPVVLELYSFFQFYFTKSYTGKRTPLEMLNVNIVFVIVGLLFYFWQYRKLRFETITTNLSREAVEERIMKTAKELDWIIVKKTNDLIVGKTNPKWTTGSWGEQITIIFDGKRILANSICDPDRKSSVASYGRNKKNIKTLIENIHASR